MSESVVGMDYQNSDETTWMVDVDGMRSNVIKNYLLADGIPEDGVSCIIQNAAKVLSYCPNPATNEPCEKTGIVIGKVQSGKTSNFISLTALAFDNGYNIVVVLGGTKKPLVKQNSDRIREYFAASKDILVLNTNEYRDLLNEQKINQFIQMGRKIIVVALKSPSQIKFITTNMFMNTSLSEKATLIIDDEGDEASLNTLVSKNKKSSTYLEIENLKKRLERHCFVSVTATPQANLLVGTLSVLSPDFGVLVDPGKGYCGLDVFHGANSKYTIPIPKDEASLLDDGIPNSFIDALSVFFIGCAIYKLRGMKVGDKLSMLIHPSQLKADHKTVFNKVDDIISIWRKNLENTSDIAYESLRNILYKAYKKYQDEGTEVFQFDLLENEVLNAIKFCGLHIVNGDKVPNGADKIYDFNIYVGGSMLGRGLTLAGLAITYIIRTAKGTSAVDTVQQRARWFGYKTKYLDLCRIYAVDKIIKEFKEIRDHEEDLWETVRTANMQGTRFKDIARIFVLSDDLKMTRTSVAKTDNYSFAFWNFQRKFQEIPEYISNNVSIIKQFMVKHEAEIATYNFGDGSPFKAVTEIPFADVKADIINKFIFPEASKLNKPLIDKLDILLKRKSVNAITDVIWMRYGDTSKHKVIDGHIPEYMVGRRPQDKSLPTIYGGDRYQFNKDNVIQLQIHMIEDTESRIISPTLALYIPEDYVEILTNLVIRS